MKLKILLILMLAAVTFTSYAQDGGIRGKVVSRNGRVALSNVRVKIESLGLTVMTDKDGNFVIENLPAGDYTLSFATPEFEPLNLMVRVDNRNVQDLQSVIIVPTGHAVRCAGRRRFRRIRQRLLVVGHAGAAFVALFVEGPLQQHRIVPFQRDAFQRPRLRFAVLGHLPERHPLQRRHDGLRSLVAVERTERRDA
ncbi:MAG: beta-sandwich domain-containing protein [Alistipes shahii]|uniref:beta-sandwich domain-containing protein n=1 Tax=Alistipes shahii TaxID=328814 RepID=UPI00399CBCBB